MDQNAKPKRRVRAWVAGVAAVAALAVAVPASGAVVGSSDGSGTSAGSSQSQKRDRSASESREHRTGRAKRDCPKHRGQNRGGPGGSSGSAYQGAGAMPPMQTQ